MQKNIRNIAVIAHVDHGKTTLVDALLKQTNVFRDNQEEMFQERILDTNELEQEKGITILAKLCSIEYKNFHINIIDTPGHVDFSGEVERTLSMADGALLIVDSKEGPMAQTRFVLKKALELNLKVIVVINKIDKPDARVDYVENKLGDLFLELATKDSHLDFPILYAVGKNGTVFEKLPQNSDSAGNVIPLLEAIVNKIPSPSGDTTKPFKMLVSTLDYDSHIGRILIGRIHQGKIKIGQTLVIAGKGGDMFKVESLTQAKGLKRTSIEEAGAGEIVALAGNDKANIGDTVCDPADTVALIASVVAEPTIHITIGANTSPFTGSEGEFTTSRQLQARLVRELENNVSLKVEQLSNGKFKISGRGELHLAILLETMRREGYEMEVGKPEVVIKKIDNVKCEPVEEITIIVPGEYSGIINQELGKRMAIPISFEKNSKNEEEFVYHMPTRAVIGLRSALLTLTKGTVLISSQVLDYKPLGNPLPKFRKGALISAETGMAVEYGLRNLKGRGISFISPGTKVYEGMIVGLNSRDQDIEMNVCKEKHLTNHRSKSHDGITALAPDIKMSLEKSLEFLEADELLEITPKSLRLRKRHLTDLARRNNRKDTTSSSQAEA